MEDIDDKQSMTSTINQFTDNFGIVNKQSPQKETNKISTTSTNKFKIAQQAANWVSTNMHLSDNMSNREMKSPRESGIGNVHFVNKNNYTPESS